MASQEKEKTLYNALERVDSNTCFVFHRVKPEFYPGGSFSSVQLQLQVPLSDGSQPAVKFSTLFKVDATNPKFDAAKEFIHRCRKKGWPTFHMKSEKDVMLVIASQILVHISPEVTMEKRYQTALSSLVSRNPTLPKTLTTSPLGMGNKYAWHGTIDTRVRGSVVISQGEEEGELEYQSEGDGDESSTSESEQSDGTTTNVEEKVKAGVHHKIGVQIVSSFQVITLYCYIL